MAGVVGLKDVFSLIVEVLFPLSPTRDDAFFRCFAFPMICDIGYRIVIVGSVVYASGPLSSIFVQSQVICVMMSAVSAVLYSLTLCVLEFINIRTRHTTIQQRKVCTLASGFKVWFSTGDGNN